MAENEEQSVKDILGIGKLVHFVNHDTIYRIVKDYTESDNPMAYQLENIDNKSDTLTVGIVQVEQNIGKRWKVINLNNVPNR